MDKNIFWIIGHKITNHKLSHSRNLGLRRFKAFFGISPEICEIVWTLLENEIPQGSQPKHLLWALIFLKQCNSESTNKKLLNADEKTIRKWTWCFVQLLSELKVINWNKRKENSNRGQRCFVSLDGVDFKILEPKPFNPKYYSHKFKAAGLRYEIGLCIRTGNIIWQNGGYPCGDYPDLRLAYMKYIHMVEENELTLADKGYKNSRYFLLPHQTNEGRHKQIMSRHETVNKRIRQFKILYVPFRYNISKHKICFGAVVNLTQLCIENGAPLYSIY